MWLKPPLFQANDAYLKRLPTTSGIQRLGLSFPVTNNHFVNKNRVRLKCLASISNFYWKSAEISLLQEKPKFASVMKNGEGPVGVAANSEKAVENAGRMANDVM